MKFDIDKQTFKDLELFGERGNDQSVFSVYSRTATTGGREMLNKLFKTPVSDIEFLQYRKDEINFFFENKCSIKLFSKQFDFIEHYLNIFKKPLQNNIVDAVYKGILNVISPDGDYWIISNGIYHIITLLIEIELFIKEAGTFSIPSTLEEDYDRIKTFLTLKSIRNVLSDPPKDAKDLSYVQINNLDHLFRETHKNQTREFLDIVYKIDILQTLSRLMKKEGFTLPEYSPGSQPMFEVTDAFHPLLSAPVSNSFTFNQNSHLCFLTGPNMSGKSTFLKTLGLMIYLSHLGFPVPAKKLKISVFDGLFTTINLADNMNYGYSHFYSEVKRVKDIAEKINTDRKLVVIFDELFRGTNVKDAFDASLMIISALSKIKGNLFFISTHILEVAENLQCEDPILFKCFESELLEDAPVYDYKLKEGTSKERIGMLIVNNEHIIEILNEVIEKQKKAPKVEY
jgi:DNA mismatch repair protein MutS